MLQDRATASLGGVISIPRLTIATDYQLHEGDSGMWVYSDPEAPTREVEVPVDFYLREAADVDPTDFRSVAFFIDEWGLPVDRLNRDLMRPDHIDFAEWEIAAGVEVEDARELAAVELGWVEKRAPMTLQQAVDDAKDYPARMAKIGRLVNWAEVRYRLDRMQGFLWSIDNPNKEHPDDFASAIEDLNAALWVFAPRLEPNGTAPPKPTIYNVVAAQIANDLHEGATFLACQNETCKRTFTKQRGRAEKGTHRTKGVMYCSKDCAKAQAQRELRRRRRRDANSDADGSTK